MARTAVPPADLLLAAMGAPHGSDQTTTMLRLAQSALERGAAVQVWTCGYATMLTQRSLGEAKPRNVLDWTTEYPSVPTLVRTLLADFAATLHWYSCRFCSTERGAVDHIDEVVVRPPFKFGEHVAAARRTLMVGVI